ncbi:MAG: hypothetical protein ABW047_16095 [Nitrospiraceae bacterium]
MKECDLGRIAQDRSVRLAHFQNGQGLGERAVETDERSPAAHFALFCNLGELSRIDGEASVTSVLGLRRVLKELDRTIELAPDHLDALSAKGTFLIRLPTLLGGEQAKGRGSSQDVIRRDPSSVNARLSLAKSYCGGGRHDEAISLASHALDLADRQQSATFIHKARDVLAQLRARGAKANQPLRPGAGFNPSIDEQP